MYFVFPSQSNPHISYAIAPLIIAALVSAAMKAGTGIYQGIQSRKYAKEKRPPYDIPDEYTAMLESAKAQAKQIQLPGQALAEEKLAASTSRSISAARESTDSPAALLGVVAGLNEGERGNITDFGIAAGANYNANQATLRTALGEMGTQKALQWQWDKQMPYLNAMDTAANLQEASQTNIMAGLEDVAGTAMSAWSTKEYLDAQKDINKAQIDAYKATYGTGGGNEGADMLGNKMALEELAALGLGSENLPKTLSSFDILSLYKNKPKKGILNDPYAFLYGNKNFLSSYIQ